MNKLLKVLGGIFLAILIVIAVAAAIIIPKGLALDKDAVSYIEANIPLVVEKWNSEELKKRAAPELLAQPGVEQLPKLFSWLSSLGKLEKLEKPIGQVGTGVFPGSQFNGTWGDYVVNAKFEAGSAQIKVVLRRSGETWQIMGFHVNSQALFPQGASPSINTDAAR
ncbi:hypothetical protein G3580_08415 [Nitrogeniibacter mangrovi]|uniref:DUF2939 domain-containing protein n=1 Tax=Nitrogeniibacter mangrovi TaxID=2016596 RepID=A0A6C1B5Z6_9RHOO|nr:hypothetical protein [Nitrogeniibacter mangrovi]QID17664.1 hypothetical protein G3580_08415 [Nitrogeniibacter mangrovi]